MKFNGCPRDKIPPWTSITFLYHVFYKFRFSTDLWPFQIKCIQPLKLLFKCRKTAFLGGFSAKGGPSDRIRTCGILLPKQARYQLRYTRLFSLFIRLVVFSQTRRDTNFAIPGYSISAIIPRRGRKSKIFLSVVIYVVKAAFMPLSAIGGNLANAGVTRLCGVSPCPVPDTATALPNHPRYQLR